MKTTELASAFDVSFRIPERDDRLARLTRCRRLLHNLVHSDDIRRSELDTLYRELGELSAQLSVLDRASGFQLDDDSPESARGEPVESGKWRTLEPTLLPPTAAVDLPSDTRTALLTFIEESPVPLLLVRVADTRICYANRRASELFETSSAELNRQTLDERIGDVSACQGFWSELESKARTDGTLLPLRTGTGRHFWSLTSAQLITHEGEQCAFLGLSDITAQKLAEGALRKSETNLRALLAAAPVALLALNPKDNEVLFTNERADAMLGARERPARGRAFHEFLWDQRDSTLLAERLASGEAIDGLSLRLRTAAGTRRWAQLSVQWLDFDEDNVLLFGITDVTEQKELEQRLIELATHDGLTGLYNRRHFVELAERELSRAARSHCPVSLCMLDADQFKQMNDEYGHAVGDRALTTLARATRGMLRAQDIFGRVGGEEFAVLLPDTRIEGAMSVAERIRRSVEVTQVPTAHSAPVWITVSIGVAQHRPGEGFESLLRRADHALYVAKDSGRNRVAREE